jgi:hypothetical protein
MVVWLSQGQKQVLSSVQSYGQCSFHIGASVLNPLGVIEAHASSGLCLKVGVKGSHYCPLAV